MTVLTINGMAMNIARSMMIVIAFALLLQSAFGAHFKENFQMDLSHWKSHSELTSSIKMTYSGGDSAPATLSIVPAVAGEFVVATDFTPFTVTDRTMIRFKIRMDQSQQSNGITFLQSAGNPGFQLRFPVRSDSWITVQKYIYKATPVFGETGEGLLGRACAGIQFSLNGTQAELAEVEIFESSGHDEELPLMDADTALEEYLTDYVPQQYPVLQRNGFFPYGMVTIVRANVHSAQLFGRSAQEACRDDLVDMRRHYLNTYINFWETLPLEDRLQFCEEIGMRLIETIFCLTNFAELEAGSPIEMQFQQAKASPALLAWYGRDEPSPSQLPEYLASKKALNAMDRQRPLVSALHLPGVRQKIGPALEVMIPDIYNFYPGTPTDGSVVLPHFEILRQAREQTAGKRIWYMPQTFSNRHGHEGKITYSARYPTPEEMRLELHIAAAAGSSGIIFFAYNDYVTYLDQELRAEEFDYTPVDQWGNGNAVYDVIAEFGQRFVPIMPSFLDAESGDYLTIHSDNPQLLHSQLRNEQGILLHLVNRSTEQGLDDNIEIVLLPGMKLYELEHFAEISSNYKYSLPPGGGQMLMAASPEGFALVAQEIAERRAAQEAELAELRLRELATAGFADGKATSEWLEAEAAMTAMQKLFGTIHQRLIIPGVIERAESAPEFQVPHQMLLEASKEYFRLRSALKHGKIPDGLELQKLQVLVQNTDHAYRELLAIETPGK